MVNLLFWLAGFVVGIGTCIIWRKSFTSGTLEVDTSDPEIPYLRLQVRNEQIDAIPKKKYVLFKVDSKATFTRQKQSL